MAFPTSRKIAIISLTIIFLLESLAFAQDARLENIIVTHERDNLNLSLDVAGAFKEKMKRAVLSGVPTTFSFYVTLSRVRGFWFDKEIADIKFTHTVKYNNLKKEFMVTHSWKNSGAMILHSFNEAQKLLSKVENLKVTPLSNLKKGSQYQIKAKAELSKLKLPLYLHYILFFLSLWDFETDWYTINFVY